MTTIAFDQQPTASPERTAESDVLARIPTPSEHRAEAGGNTWARWKDRVMKMGKGALLGAGIFAGVDALYSPQSTPDATPETTRPAAVSVFYNPDGSVATTEPVLLPGEVRYDASQTRESILEAFSPDSNYPNDVDSAGAVQRLMDS